MESTEVKTQIKRLAGRAPRWRGQDGGQKQGAGSLIRGSAAPGLGKPRAGAWRELLSCGVTDPGQKTVPAVVGRLPASTLSLPSTSSCLRRCPHLPEMSDSHEVFIGLFWLLCDT